MAVAGLAEVVLWSHDLDKSLAFYRDLLGLEPMGSPDLPTRFLRAGEAGAGVPSMVVLVPHPDPAGRFPDQKPRRTLHHLAFSIAPGEWEGLLGRCREAGLEIRDGVHPVLRQVRTCYLDDPDGNEVECICSTALSDR